VGGPVTAAYGPDRLGVLRAAVDGGLRSRRHLDYWASSSWAADASPVLDALEAELAHGASRGLVELLERAVGHLVKVVLRADDSNGMIGDLALRALELHTRACDAGVADPVRLARWMIRFTFEDQDFFTVDPVRYREALGDEGIAAYRTEAAKRSAPAEARASRRADLWAPFPSFAARYAVERLAVLDGDVDRLVELLGGDLSSPHQFTRVAEAMVELDRSDDALRWARRGIAETSGWQIAALYDLAASILQSRDDVVEVFQLRRDQHRRLASASTYVLLRTAAESADRWDAERAEARLVLAGRDRGGLIESLLGDGDADEAWKVATAGDWDPGERLWQLLAEAIEKTQPGDALGVYLSLADRALLTADRRAYRVAVGQLKSARRAAGAANRTDRFDEHLALLRAQHRRRPSLISMLDKAGLH